MTNKQRGNLLWILTAIGAFLALPLFYLLFIESPLFDTFQYLPVIFFAVVMFLHSLWKIGTKRTLLLWGLASSIGFTAEYFGLKYGQLFGGSYDYIAGQLSLFTVPVEVMVFWAVFIYIGYSMTTGFLETAGISKPVWPSKKGLILLLLLVLLDGLIVTGLDVIMDPVQIALGRWAWADSGPFYDIPTGNFTGWFTVSALTVLIFRLFEYFRPANFDRIANHAELLPTVAYLNMMLIMSLYAYNKGMHELVLLSFFVMLPVVVVSLILYLGGAISSRAYYYDK